MSTDRQGVEKAYAMLFRLAGFPGALPVYHFVNILNQLSKNQSLKFEHYVAGISCITLVLLAVSDNAPAFT